MIGLLLWNHNIAVNIIKYYALKLILILSNSLLQLLVEFLDIIPNKFDKIISFTPRNGRTFSRLNLS